MPNATFARTPLLSVVCALAATACASQPAPAAAPAPTERDTFGKEWIALFQTESQPEAEAALRALRQKWLGQRVTWEVQIVEPFCRAAAQDPEVEEGRPRDGGTCNVRAFDYAKLPPAAQQAMGGALPALELGHEDFTRLTRECLAHGTKCVARVDAKMVLLTEDTDAPLRLRLADVHLLGIRAARADERFERIVRPHVARRELPRSARPDRS